jgi:hypothetical protein
VSRGPEKANRENRGRRRERKTNTRTPFLLNSPAARVAATLIMQWRQINNIKTKK